MVLCAWFVGHLSKGNVSYLQSTEPAISQNLACVVFNAVDELLYKTFHNYNAEGWLHRMSNFTMCSR